MCSTGKPVRTVCTGCAEVCAALVSQYAQFVLDALRYVQSVEVGKERSDVVSCHACGSVDDGLQTVQVTAGQAGDSDVAVVQFDMTKLEISVDSVDRGTDDAASLSKDAEARAHEPGNVHVAVQVDAEVAY